MSVLTVPRGRFDWPAFARAVRAFAVAHGLEEAFPVVHDGRVVYWPDHDELLDDRDDLDGVPGPPLERLRAGLDIFVQFTMPGERGGMVCADGDTIELPDLDGEPAKLLADEQRRLAEKTVCDECHAYGFVVSLEGARLVFQTVLFSDSDGECHVECVVEPGLADEPMESTRAALRRAAADAEVTEFDLFAEVLAMSSESGGNLPAMLDRLAASIRDRNQYRGYFRSVTALARMAAIFLALAAPVALLLYAIFPEQRVLLVRFFLSSEGQIIFLVAVILEVIGILWILWLLRKQDDY